jgi:rhodanese-related sulfurtransferase
LKGELGIKTASLNEIPISVVRGCIMANIVTRHEVQRLGAQGAILIEVLPAEEYRLQHLPKAISMPLKHLTPGGVGQLSRDVPIVVYCFDSV